MIYNICGYINLNSVVIVVLLVSSLVASNGTEKECGFIFEIRPYQVSRKSGVNH